MSLTLTVAVCVIVFILCTDSLS